MTTTIDDLAKKWTENESNKMIQQQLEEAAQDVSNPERIAYYNNLWKKCDSLGINFSAQYRKRFHNTIHDFPIEQSKRYLFDIIKELQPDYDFTEHNKPIILDLLYYFTGHSAFSGGVEGLKRNICLIGPPGAGKTFLMSCFMVLTAQLKYRAFKCYHCEEVAMKLKSNIHLIDDYTNYPAMFDDLFAEDRINVFGDNIDTMQYILKVRQRKMITTHATSLFNEKDILERCQDQYMKSRVQGMFNFIYLWSDKDYRTWKK